MEFYLPLCRIPAGDVAEDPVGSENAADADQRRRPPAPRLAAPHGPSGDGPPSPSIGRPPRSGRRQPPRRPPPFPAGPRHAACGGPVRAQGSSGAEWVGRPALHAAASPPMSPWGGYGGREQIYGRRCAARVFGFAATPRTPPVPGGCGGWLRGHPRLVACPFRRQPSPRPRCHAASARPAPCPPPRSAAPPWLARSGVGPGPPAPHRTSLRRLRPRCHAAPARPAPRLLPRSAARPWLARSGPVRGGPARRGRPRPGRPPGLHAGRAAAFIGPPPCGPYV